MAVQLLFLGTGGGRFATIYQTRSTGGFMIRDNATLHVDPGPGALSNMRSCGIDPFQTDAILISHCHPDHYSDAEVLLEGMTGGGIRERGMLVGSRSVLEGVEGIGPALSRYHRGLPPIVKSVTPGDSLDVAGMRVDFTPTWHSDPYGVGMIFHSSAGKISYVSDSEIREDVVEAHRGSRVLMLSVTRPRGSKVHCHLCTEGAIEFVNALKPELVLMTHLGVRMVKAGPEREARAISDATGVRVVAARDLMGMRIDDDIEFTMKD